jgi:hypothetical protein
MNSSYSGRVKITPIPKSISEIDRILYNRMQEIGVAYIYYPQEGIVDFHSVGCMSTTQDVKKKMAEFLESLEIALGDDKVADGWIDSKEIHLCRWLVKNTKLFAFMGHIDPAKDTEELPKFSNADNPEKEQNNPINNISSVNTTACHQVNNCRATALHTSAWKHRTCRVNALNLPMKNEATSNSKDYLALKRIYIHTLSKGEIINELLDSGASLTFNESRSELEELLLQTYASENTKMETSWKPERSINKSLLEKDAHNMYPYGVYQIAERKLRVQDLETIALDHAIELIKDSAIHKIPKVDYRIRKKLYKRYKNGYFRLHYIRYTYDYLYPEIEKGCDIYIKKLDPFDSHLQHKRRLKIEDLDIMNANDIKAIARVFNIENYWTITKANLIDIIFEDYLCNCFIGYASNKDGVDFTLCDISHYKYNEELKKQTKNSL